MISEQKDQQFGVEVKTNNPDVLNVYGIGILKVSDVYHAKFDVLYQKGIGLSLIQNIFEMYKNEIASKQTGSSFVPMTEYSIFLTHFVTPAGKFVLFYLENNASSGSYPRIYKHAKKIQDLFSSGSSSIPTIQRLCRDSIDIPIDLGVGGVFILDKNGIPLFSKVLTKEEASSSLVGGFISAILSFSKYVVGSDPNLSGQLKEINFGNCLFTIVEKKGIIFAFLVKTRSQSTTRYMNIIVDEFINSFENQLNNFYGNVSIFEPFEETINQYFKI